MKEKNAKITSLIFVIKIDSINEFDIQTQNNKINKIK